MEVRSVEYLFIPFPDACGPSAIPQYALVADADIAEGLKVETRDVTKATCTHFCNVNRNDKGEAYPCKAFGYHEADKACYLFDERAYQSGPANATEGEGILVFEKVCLTGMCGTCRFGFKTAQAYSFF